MTLTKAKLLWAAAMFAAAWFFRENKGGAKTVTGDVQLGVPTVDGVYGNDLYWSKRGTIAAPDEPDPTLQKLIDESNAAIAAAGGPP